MRVILFESQGDWAALVRPRTPAGVALVETRSIDETLERLCDVPNALVLVQWQPARGRQLVDLLQSVRRDFVAAHAAVLGNREPRDLEILVREAGAIEYFDSTRQIASLMALISHHIEQSTTSAPAAESDFSLEDRIRANLPWGD